MYDETNPLAGPPLATITPEAFSAFTHASTASGFPVGFRVGTSGKLTPEPAFLFPPPLRASLLGSVDSSIPDENSLSAENNWCSRVVVHL